MLNNHFDRELFKKKCQEFYHLNSTSQLSEIYHTQPDAYRSKHLPIVNVADIDESMVNKTILVMVVLHRIKVIVDKKGNQMAFISGNDDTGELEATIFSNQYRRYSEDPSHPLEKDRTVLMNVRVQKREDALSLVMNQIKKVK